MKKIFAIVVATFLVAFATAQIPATLFVSGNPPSTLSEWAFRKDALFLQVQRGAGVQLSYKIKTEIRLLDGTVITRNDLAKATTYQWGSANVIYYAPDVLPLELMQFTGKYKTTFDKTGKLPADNYQLCVRLVNPIDFAPLSNENCRSFYVASLQLPILMKPAADEELNYDLAKTAITFRWTPVVPKPQSVVTYKLLVFEVLQNQNPVQALRSNKPILDKEVRGTTQYIWQPQGIINDIIVKDSTKPKQYVGHVSLIKRTINPAKADSAITYDEVEELSKSSFVWTIQALDAQGNPLGDGNVNGDGVSEPVQFFVRGKVKDIKHDPGTMRKTKEN